MKSQPMTDRVETMEKNSDTDQAPAGILLIDDHPLLRRGITQLLEMEDDMTLAGEASNSADGIRLATELEPDLILLDLNMPGVNGLETLRQLQIGRAHV